MNWLLSLAAVCVLVPSVHCATATGWCYHNESCNDTQWPTLFPSYCAGSRQSPIDIVSASATADSNLTAFTFTNYDNNSALKEIKNTGKTVKITLTSGIKISGGGLSEPYDSLQFHLHWGNGSSVPGSEHTVNGKRYPMELHIVNSKATYNGDTALALKDSTGLAALGFFIEEMSGNAIGQPAKWNVLSSYLSEIVTSGQSYTVPSGISLDDLLKGVDRSKYYRYLGSLTTPTCNEAVVWTVFKDTIKVSKDVIDRFSTTVRIADDSSELMVEVFRGVQPAQPVTTQSSCSTSGYSLGLMALSLVLGRG
ncbi:Carbonic anhydrase 4 [Dissostichus eleginoides]|uniref:Carbonic anhydrase n=1 Tax=Dissostichus eleginoides TaxID=100907 RepID=A0AAD9BE61_DISEL|nr:Carbonic anhydrase 4 [Dissostichus eleginoides]